MKKKLLGLLITLLITVLALGMSACGGDDKENEAAADASQSGTEETQVPEEEGPEAVDTITDIDTEDMMDIPLQMESITLFDDGTVAIVPLDDLKRNAESNNELKDGAMYPFEDIGKVSKIYLVSFGNGGYRTLIALMDDGTLSALSANELIQDHIVVVMPNMTGRDNYTEVKQVKGEDAFSVIGVTEDGEEIELDFSLNF